MAIIDCGSAVDYRGSAANLGTTGEFSLTGDPPSMAGALLSIKSAPFSMSGAPLSMEGALFS